MPKHGKQGNSKKETKYISPEKALHIILKSPSREECLKLEEKLKQTPNSMSRECVLKCLDVKVDILALLEHNMNQVTTTDQIEKLNKKAELIDDKIKKIHAKSNELTDDLKREINTFKNKRLSEVETFKKELRQKENSLKETAQKKELQQKSNTNDVTSQIQPTEKEIGAKQKERFEKRIEKKEVKKEKRKIQQEKPNKELKLYQQSHDLGDPIQKKLYDIAYKMQEYKNGNQSKNLYKEINADLKAIISQLQHLYKTLNFKELLSSSGLEFSGLEQMLSFEGMKKITEQINVKKQDPQKDLNSLDDNLINGTLTRQGLDHGMECILKILTQPSSKIEDCTCEGACACNTKSHQ